MADRRRQPGRAASGTSSADDAGRGRPAWPTPRTALDWPGESTSTTSTAQAPSKPITTATLVRRRRHASGRSRTVERGLLARARDSARPAPRRSDQVVLHHEHVDGRGDLGLRIRDLRAAAGHERRGAEAGQEDAERPRRARTRRAWLGPAEPPAGAVAAIADHGVSGTPPRPSRPPLRLASPISRPVSAESASVSPPSAFIRRFSVRSATASRPAVLALGQVHQDAVAALDGQARRRSGRTGAVRGVSWLPSLRQRVNSDARRAACAPRSGAAADGAPVPRAAGPGHGECGCGRCRA